PALFPRTAGDPGVRSDAGRPKEAPRAAEVLETRVFRALYSSLSRSSHRGALSSGWPFRSREGARADRGGAPQPRSGPGDYLRPGSARRSRFPEDLLFREKNFSEKRGVRWDSDWAGPVRGSVDARPWLAYGHHQLGRLARRCASGCSLPARDAGGD